VIQRLLSACLLFTLLVACSPTAPAAPPPELSEEPLGRVALPGTEVRQLHSTHTDRDYDIYVRFPESYQTGSGNYPTLYVLDGQWDFKLMDSIYGGLHYDLFVPEMFIIGITYSGENADYGSLRAMDYTPVPEWNVPGSGDGPKFYDFLTQELVPFVETEYRVDPAQRALMGSSYAGLFTLYALFREPAFFRGYISGSPVVTYGDGFLVQQEAEYAESNAGLPARLFLAVGEIESLAGPVEQYARLLESRNYEGLALEHRVIEGERHAGNKPEAFNRGLRFLFEVW
jgi:predicted alpha/beta superfamily hydrolase